MDIQQKAREIDRQYKIKAINIQNNVLSQIISSLKSMFTNNQEEVQRLKKVKNECKLCFGTGVYAQPNGEDDFDAVQCPACSE